MDLKRNPINSLPVNPSKSNNLIQPFIGISKASTPLRTRLVPPTSQPNSTPINITKIPSNIHKSPNNKQNFQTNYHRFQTGVKTYTVPSQIENRINLSPVLALNRKLNEGPQNFNKKSFTPEVHKVIEDYQGFNSEGMGQLDRNYTTLNLLNDSKGQNNFSNTTNFTNLRGSNCFKALIENRTKTPNRFQSSSSKLMQKRDSAPSLKQSLSSNQLFKNFGRESKVKLSQSRSFDNLKAFSGSRLDSSEIKCMNNDGKKAKYRVINSEQQRDRSCQTQLYYCSKCTIPLVQQGFIVQEIAKETPKVDSHHQQTRRYHQYSLRLDDKRKNIQNMLTQIQIKEENQNKQLDQYYDSVIQFIENERQSDHRAIEEYYERKKEQPISLIQKINSCCEAIDQINANPYRKGSKINQIQQVLDINQNNLCNPDTIHFYNVSMADLTNKFIKYYQNYLRLPLQRSRGDQSEQNSYSKGNQSISNRNHAMRFSFQKLITDMNTRKPRMQDINTLKEVEEQQQNQLAEPQRQQHTAFRDLFPEEEQGEHINNGIHSPTFKHI